MARLCKLRTSILADFSKSRLFYRGIEGLNRDFRHTYNAAPECAYIAAADLQIRKASAAQRLRSSRIVGNCTKMLIDGTMLIFAADFEVSHNDNRGWVDR
jgi:hypothetical protein